MSLLDSIEKHEGFRSKPYPDPIHGWDVPTFGHGLTYITEDESRQIVKNRITEIEASLKIKVAGYFNLPHQARNVLVEMAYQMGVPGLMKFKNTLEFIEKEDFQSAADEMLDSVWAKQTPKRAQDLAEIMRHLA